MHLSGRETYQTDLEIPMADTQKVWKAIQGILSKFDCTLSKQGDVITIDCTNFEEYTKEIHSALCNYPWYVAVGIGHSSLFVYVNNVKEAKKVVGKTWKNVPIEISRMGKIRAAIGNTRPFDPEKEMKKLQAAINKSKSEIKQGKARILDKKEFKKRYGVK